MEFITRMTKAVSFALLPFHLLRNQRRPPGILMSLCLTFFTEVSLIYSLSHIKHHDSSNKVNES